MLVDSRWKCHRCCLGAFDSWNLCFQKQTRLSSDQERSLYAWKDNRCCRFLFAPQKQIKSHPEREKQMKKNEVIYPQWWHWQTAVIEQVVLFH